MKHTASPNICTECARPLPAGLPSLMCPQCLLGGALAEDDYPDDSPVMGEWRLLAEIGRGGMGVVYRAQHAHGGPEVALKTIAAGELATPEMLRRFRNEAEAAAGVQHPHLVAIREVGEHEGLPFIVMALIEGRTLAARLAAGPMPPREAAEMMRTVAQAVSCVHAHGILHRDLKPSNVLLDAAGLPFVSDFGLAKLAPGGTVSELTRSGQLIGSPAYMPPEQARGEGRHLGPEADVYSLGAILYHALTGRAPFEAASVHELLEKVEARDPVAPRRLRAEVPRDLETICLSCLEKSPSSRCHSAQELADDLGRWLEGAPIRARRSPLLRRPLRWARRRPVVAALTFLSVALVFALGANFLVAHQMAEQQRLADAARTRTEALTGAQSYAASIEPGSRARGLAAVHRAAGPDAPAELRDAAIALLTATSFDEPHSIPLPMGARAIAFSTNVDYAAFAHGNIIHIIRTSDGATILTLDEAASRKPEDGEPGMLEFSPEGTMFAVQSAGGLLRVWRFQNFPAPAPALQQMGEWQTSASAANGFASVFTKKDLGLSLRIPPGNDHPAGALALIGTGNRIRRIICESAAPGDYYLANPRLNTAAVIRANGIEIIDMSPGNVIGKIAMISIPLKITHAVWHERGERLLVGCANGAVLLYSARNGFTLPMIYPGQSAAVSRLAFCDEEQFTAAAASDDGFTRVSAGVTGQVFMELAGVTAHRASRDGTMLAGVEGTSRLLLWKKLPPVGLTRKDVGFDALFQPLEVDFAKASRLLLADCRYYVQLRDEHFKRLGQQGWEGRLQSASFTPDETRIVTVDRDGFQTLDVAGSAPIKAHTPVAGDPAWKPRRFCFGQDGTLAIEAEDNRYGVARWPDVRNIRELAGRRASSSPGPGGGTGGAGVMAVSPDGVWVAAGLPESGSAVIWDAKSGVVIKELPGAGVVHFSPDGRWLLFGGESAWHLFATGTWQEQWRVPRQGTARQLGVAAFAEDGRTLILDTSTFTLTLLAADTARVLANFPLPEPVACTSVRLHSGVLYAGMRTNAVFRWDFAILRDALRTAGVEPGF